MLSQLSVPHFIFVIPTLNTYAILPRLVDSLKDQTYQNWRVLFVDGPSTLLHRQYLIQTCNSDSRFSYIIQNQAQPGIYGAMNCGLSYISALSLDNYWVFFWGSDDFAASNNVLEKLSLLILQQQLVQPFLPDLIICSARYTYNHNISLSRLASFSNRRQLKMAEYTTMLFLGRTPPHQSTLFGSGALRACESYSLDFKLAADLNYFLQLSTHHNILINCYPLHTVNIAAGGVSSQHTVMRLREVLKAYKSRFSLLFLIPFVLRYFNRFCSFSLK